MRYCPCHEWAVPISDVFGDKRMMRKVLLAATAILGIWMALPGAAEQPKPADGLPEQIDFNRDIRPVLSNTCFACHGTDDKKRKGKLRLDTREGARLAL